MGNSKPKLSAEEEDVRKKVIEYYNKLTYSIYYNKKLYSEFDENLKNMKIKSMSIGYCPLKFQPVSIAVPNAVHAYAFFELDVPQKYMGIIIEYGPYSKNEVREDYFFCPFYPFGDGLRFGFFLREMFDEMSFLNRLKSSIIYINNKLTIGEIILNLNSNIPWDKNSYNFISHNCQDMIANIIICLQAELLDELDIINKDYELEDMPPVILRTFKKVTNERKKKNLQIQENNIFKDYLQDYFLLDKDLYQSLRKIKNKIKGIKKNENNDYYKISPKMKEMLNNLP